MSANLASLLTDTAKRVPDKVAIKLDDAELTYQQLDGASAMAAGLLQSMGVKQGDRVGIMLPNVPYFPVAYYGALRLGATVVPMNVLLSARETGFYLTDPGANVLLAWGGFKEAAEAGAKEAGAELVLVDPGEFDKLLAGQTPYGEVADVDPQDTAVILYTSGTTGKPKGAELTHANLRKNAEVAATSVIDVHESDVVLGALPLFHSFGQTCGLNVTMSVGGTLSLIPRFDPAKAVEIIERDKVTVFQGVPTMYNALLHLPEDQLKDITSLRLCVSGGSALPEPVMRAFEEKFGSQILEGYGLSETSPVATFNPAEKVVPGSIGKPIEGVELRLVDGEGNVVAAGSDEPGEIEIKGHNVMKGYWNREDATKEAISEDGWFKTGDMARMDEDGYYFIVDRKKDLIIRGGYNVYPREVEEVLYEHPAVAEAAVVAVPHDSLGEEVGAAVVLKDGAEATKEELTAHVKEQVAAYKYPRQIWFLPELPKGPTGKILKREIDVPAEG